MKVTDQEIINILAEHEIKDQSEMVSIFLGRGLEINQSSLSRKLKKLNIVKIDGIYRVSSTKTPVASPTKKIKEIKISSPNIIVVRTAPGVAQSLAYHIDNNIDGIGNDQYNLAAFGIIATIAGDDTILIVSNHADKLNEAAEIIEKFILLH